MLKIVAVVDKTGTALDRLAKGVAPYHTNLNYVVVDVHPKRPDPKQLERFESEVLAADIIDFQYFKSALMLLERYPWLKEKKLILTHNNPYSIVESNWDDFDYVVANNHTMKLGLEKIMHNPKERLSLIPLATDVPFWKFNFEWKPTKRILMVANRIESKKGILEVAIACGDLGLKFVLVGAISDANYFHDILQTGAVEFHEKISDEALRDLYYSSTMLVCNSVDNFESGTLPILEAMACGTPVLTRNVGHVPDLNDGENMVILNSQPQDVMGITEHIENMLNDSKALDDMRHKAWQSVKGYNFERRAYSYQRLYRKDQHEPVSVIVPIYDKPDIIRKNLAAIAEQDYPNIEVIICDNKGDNEGLVDEYAQTVSFPVKYVDSSGGDYGLARARNLGIIEATGDILVFCDQRVVMEPDAVSQFVKNLTPQTWLYGDKGAQKKNFVENFSCVARAEIINAGMFNERITKYGGMSQEIRERTKAQGFRHIYLGEAKATMAGKSSNRNRKKEEIYEMKNKLWKMGL